MSTKKFNELKKEMINSMSELLEYMYINNKNFTEYPSYLPSFDDFIDDMLNIEEINE